MFGIGSTELLVILVIALLVLGPKNLPKIAQTIGKLVGQFQKVSKDFQRTLNTEIALEEEADKRKEQDRLVAEQMAKKEQDAVNAAEKASAEKANTVNVNAEKTAENMSMAKATTSTANTASNNTTENTNPADNTNTTKNAETVKVDSQKSA